MLSIVPIKCWVISIVVNAFFAIPFWFCWTYCGIGVKYLNFLPLSLQAISLGACVGLSVIISILKSVATPWAIVSDVP
jgi:hypothetical protein